MSEQRVTTTIVTHEELIPYIDNLIKNLEEWYSNMRNAGCTTETIEALVRSSIKHMLEKAMDNKENNPPITH